VKYTKRLRKADPGSGAAYHIEGLLEAQTSVQKLFRALDAAKPGSQQEASLVSSIEVEVFDHLAFHVAQLRKVYKRLVRQTYDALDDKPVSPRKSRASARR
jgi:hypothetical protein